MLIFFDSQRHNTFTGFRAPVALLNITPQLTLENTHKKYRYPLIFYTPIRQIIK